MAQPLALSETRGRFPAYGYVALAALMVSELLMALRIEPFLTWFTPIQWTGYIVLLDAVLVRLRGHAYLFHRTGELLYMAAVSVAVWFLFEAYNLHLQNWRYVNLPESLTLRLIGYIWAFATIFPGVLLTSEVLDELGWFRSLRVRAVRVTPALFWSLVLFGGLCVTVPVLVPSAIARYLFAFVWVGYVFLLDPINHRLGRPSLLAQLEQGSVQKLLSLFAAGLTCGLLWEFWNYWAGTKWVYTVPFFSEPKLFEMPLFGYLGFLPFAAECYVFWQLFLHFRPPRPKD